MKKFIFVFLAILLVLLVISYKSPNKMIYNPKWKSFDVRVIRDSLGVPHILGKTDAETAYGLAYAHMEDDSETILDVILSSQGRLSLFYGRTTAPADYFTHLLRINETVNKKYEIDLNIKTRKLLEAYAEGINTFLYKFPSEKGNIAFPVKGKDIVKGFLLKTPLFFGLDRTIKDLFSKNSYELEDYVVKSTFDHLDTDIVGSNTFAINPSITSDGFTRLFVNSHQPWNGPVAWYEAHLMSEEGQNIMGGLFPGSPVILQGHNEDLGWSHTVNKPNLVDVFKLTLNPDNENQYLIDGEWVDFKLVEAPIQIKLWKHFHWTFYEKTYSSIFGPVIKKDNSAFAIQYISRQNINAVEQWYRMGKSENMKDYFSAIKAISIPMFNIGYADKDGNIAYVYNANIPKRNYKVTNKITLADNSNFKWNDYFKFNHLPVLINPNSGVIFNANNSPFLASTKDNLDPINFTEINDVFEKKSTNRSKRFYELFKDRKTITRSEFIKIKYDLNYSTSSRINEIRTNLLSFKYLNDSVITIYKHINQWNLSTEKENINTAASLLTLWPLRNETNFTKKLFENKMIEVYQFLHNRHNKTNVEWGKVNRLVRGSLNLPLDGGPDIIRAIYGEIQNGHVYGTTGDSHIMLVEWDKEGNVYSSSRHQFGASSTNKNSKHYTDQVKGFANNTLKKNIIDKNFWKTTNLYKSYHPINGEYND